MPASITSINHLADETLAYIFALLPPDERVRLERVCRKWLQVAKKRAWTNFKTLNGLELKERDDVTMKVAMYEALIHRSAPHLRELRAAAWKFDLEQWTRMRNLRHLHFDAHMATADTMHAVAHNLNRLQGIYFFDIYWISVAEVHYLLRANNASLQALRLPMSASHGDSLRLPALPSSLRLLHISEGLLPSTLDVMRDRIDELLELAASHCPQLGMLLLPTNFAVSKKSLVKLAKFEKIFYLRLRFDESDVNLFVDLLAKIGVQLKAILLESLDSRVLHLIAKYCPNLEHCSFRLNYDDEEELSPALKSLFQLRRLRSVSICIYIISEQLRTDVLAAIHGLNAKGNIEYLHLSCDLPLYVEYIINLTQRNPKLRRLTCKIRRDHTPIELGKLKTLLQNTDRPLELVLFGIDLEFGENSRARIRTVHWPESISQPMLREFWTQTMDSMPGLGNIDD